MSSYQLLPKWDVVSLRCIKWWKKQHLLITTVGRVWEILDRSSKLILLEELLLRFCKNGWITHADLWLRLNKWNTSGLFSSFFQVYPTSLGKTNAQASYNYFSLSYIKTNNVVIKFRCVCFSGRRTSFGTITSLLCWNLTNKYAENTGTILFLPPTVKYWQPESSTLGLRQL